MALSVLYVRFRDIQIIWVVVAQMLFYGTPILYPVNAWNNGVNASTKEHLLMINPLAVIFEQARVWVLAEPQAPTASEAAGGLLHLLPAAAIFVGTCIFAIWIFNREAPRIAEDLDGRRRETDPGRLARFDMQVPRLTCVVVRNRKLRRRLALRAFGRNGIFPFGEATQGKGTVGSRSKRYPADTERDRDVRGGVGANAFFARSRDRTVGA